MRVSSIAVVFVAGLSPAVGFSSYLNQMGGGGAAKPSSYGPSKGKPQAPAGGSGIGNYLQNVAAPAVGVPPPPPPPPQEPPAQGATAQVAPTSGNYLAQFGGASSMKPSTYGPSKGGKPQAPAGGSGIGSYLSNNFGGAPAGGAPPPPPAAPAAQTAPTSGNYLAQFGGASSMKPSTYGPGKGGKPQAPAGGSGIGNYLSNNFGGAPAGGAPPPPPPPAPGAPATQAAPTSGNYLAQFGGASSMKPSSYGPGKGGKPQAPVGGSGIGNYLSNVGGGAAASSAPPPPAPAAPAAQSAPTSGNYLAQFGGASSMKPSTYGPGKGGKPQAPVGGSGIGNYLSNVGGGAAASSVPPPPPPPPAPTGTAQAAPTSGNYLAQFGGASSMKPSSYGPGKGGKPQAPAGGSGIGNYLSNVGGGAAASSVQPPPPPPAPTAQAAAPAANSAPTSASYLAQMTGAGTMKPASYGPGKGGKPQAPAAGSGMSSYLNNMSGSGAAPSAPAAAVPAPSAPAVEASSGGDTLIAQEPVLTAINDLNANMVANQEATIVVLHDINSSVKTLAEKTI